MKYPDVTVNCVDCGVAKTMGHYDAKRRGIEYRCRPCGIRNAFNGRRKTEEEKKARQVQYFMANKEKLSQYQYEYNRKQRNNLIDEFGGKCVHCGESDPIVLDFDHINNDGHEDKKKYGNKSIVDLIKSDIRHRDRFQLLCKNCNWRKEYNRRKIARKYNEQSGD